MENMPNEESQTESLLGDLLPKYVTRVLARNGITTIEGVRKAYPNDLLKIWGLGALRLRQIERIISNGTFLIPIRNYSNTSQIKDFSLNGALSSATVLALARGGILTAEQLCAMHPKDLLKIRGLGLVKLREIERVFFPSQQYELPRGRRAMPMLPDVPDKNT